MSAMDLVPTGIYIIGYQRFKADPKTDKFFYMQLKVRISSKN